MTTSLEHGKDYPLRSMIIAPKDHVLISCDLSQAEAWIVAYLSNDPIYKSGLLSGDVHSNTARFIFDKSEVTKEERYIGKRCNHALSYGMSYLRFVQVVNKESDIPPYVIITNAEGKLYYEKWHTSYVNIQAWWKDTESQLNADRTLVTPYGRARHFHANWGHDLFKEAYAFVPQSTVADHFRGAIQPELNIPGGVQLLRKRLPSEVRIVNQAHDSVMVECPIAIQDDMKHLMVNCLKRPIIIKHDECIIPVDCEVGERWGELAKVKVA